MEEKIKAALDKIRPALKADGGDVEYVDFDEAEGIVKVRMTGACGGCPFASMTLAQGIEKTVVSEVPEVKKVVAV